jgi:multiple sugar transport system substrate-binding protein
MPSRTRRNLLKAATTGALAVSSGLRFSAPARAAFEPKYPIEKGASLRVLRWKRFVQGDEDLWMANTRKFSELAGVPVRVDSENFEDIRPKAAVAANVGSGPDIVYGWFDDPHLYADRLVDVTDLADYLGGKYGGWYDVVRRYCVKDGRWIAIAMGILGGCVTYRRSMIQAAGFEAIPKDLPNFLKLLQALKTKSKPCGFALGNAVGDANAWCHWLIWAHGGKLVDERNNVVINSKETIAALDYGKAMYQTFIEGTLSWLDPSNNKAFLAEDIALTLNGISIYYAAKKSEDPRLRELAKDIYHAPMPVGPVGRPTELNLFSPGFIFKFTRYPNAAKEYIRFMMEKDQYEAWQRASIGYVAQPLKAYRSNPIWTVDPKHTPFRDIPERTLDDGYAGKLGPASAAVMADYVLVNMVAAAVSGESEPQAAAQRAQRRVEHYYSRVSKASLSRALPAG